MNKKLTQITPMIWEIPKETGPGMRVDARIYADQEIMNAISEDLSLKQLANIATLPGIEGKALAMPDIHQGYGFPIGGIAGIRTEDGVISPGGVGYDINCGVRLLASKLKLNEISNLLPALATEIQKLVPNGMGEGGAVRLEPQELEKVLEQGAHWAVRNGFGQESDLENTEERGCFAQADAACVSDRAKERGRGQLGSIGSGNHFVEIQEVETIFEPDPARTFGLFQGQLAIMIHTGSRGLGHQVCTDYVRVMNRIMEKYGIQLPDRELACAPFHSEEGQNYFKAMAAAANFAWCNRQVITHNVRIAWKRILKNCDSHLELVYDMAHNIAKREIHHDIELIVHRKGATRAFGPGSPDLPDHYRSSGQPVLIPGSMGTFSYVLAGTEAAMQNTFGSCCHGAGRSMSRMKAKKTINYDALKSQLEDYGVLVRAGSPKGLLEEAPQAYKDVNNVVNVVVNSGIARKVARLRPVAVIKG